ncbi:MAG: hypothetical protein MMC33_009034 [Icmadophila ericetorum]|nr:hypothetical protein [Icmadophila ericetorum]
MKNQSPVIRCALSGDQAVLQCSSGNYCCDTNRPDVANLNDPDSACCYTGASQFSLPQGSVIAVIGGGPTVDPTPTVVPDSSPSSTAVTLLPIPPLVTTTTSPAPPITTTPTLTPTPTATSPTQSDSAPVSSTSITSDSSSNPVATSFRVITTVVTNPAGLSTSITDLAPAQTTTALPTPSSSPKRTLIGAIIGGVIALLLAVAILFLCIRKRRQNRDSIFVNTPQDLYTDAPYGYGQKHELPGSSPVLQKPQAVGLGLAGGKDMQEGSDYNGGGAENRRSELDGTPILGTSVSPTVVSEVSGDSPLPQRYEERVPFLRVGQRRGQDSINTLSQASTAVGSQLGQPIFHGIG